MAALLRYELNDNINKLNYFRVATRKRVETGQTSIKSTKLSYSLVAPPSDNLLPRITKS